MTINHSWTRRGTSPYWRNNQQNYQEIIGCRICGAQFGLPLADTFDHHGLSQLPNYGDHPGHSPCAVVHRFKVEDPDEGRRQALCGYTASWKQPKGTAGPVMLDFADGLADDYNTRFRPELTEDGSESISQALDVLGLPDSPRPRRKPITRYHQVNCPDCLFIVQQPRQRLPVKPEPRQQQATQSNPPWRWKLNRRRT